jgi:hypothetical protein
MYIGQDAASRILFGSRQPVSNGREKNPTSIADVLDRPPSVVALRFRLIYES